MTRILISAVFLMLAWGGIADIFACGREDFEFRQVSHGPSFHFFSGGFDLHMDMSGTDVTVAYMVGTEFWRE